MRFNIPDDRWEAAKTQAKAIMIGCAATPTRGLITYSDLVSKISAWIFDPHGHPLDLLLKEIAMEEDAAGRGMLTVLVVHKGGDNRPGNNFFTLARSLGRDISNREDFWIAELQRVYAAHQRAMTR
ncbi:MAG TPA: hypothetical protein VJY15_20560 [Candidatus Acidoferrum sp.]|nr:hypothetical protein [Candidatus Acidoferrum sp.]